MSHYKGVNRVLKNLSYTVKGKDSFPIKRISPSETGTRGLQHLESVPLTELFHTRLLCLLSCLPPTRIICASLELNAVMLNLVSPVWGMGAERELECGVQMCEGESKAYQLLVPEGGGLFLVFVADSAGEVIS